MSGCTEGMARRLAKWEIVEILKLLLRVPGQAGTIRQTNRKWQ